MKNSLLILAMLTSSILVFPQVNLEWAKGVGGTDSDGGQSVAIDAAGNIFIVGYFEETVDFDPNAGTTNLTAVDRTDIFVQKLDAGGNLLWAKSMGGTDEDVGLSSIVDASGNIYTTGYFAETVDFDPNAGTVNIKASGYQDIFVQKLDAGGNLAWAKTIGGDQGIIAKSIAMDISGNIYLTGSFSGTVDFDPGSGTQNITAKGSKDIFILKLDTGGNLVWVKSMGGTQSIEGLSITVDASGNVYTTGSFRGMIDFDPNSGVSNIYGTGLAIFIQKLDVNGNLVWAKAMMSNSIAFNSGRSITVDALGNVYSTGSFEETADFDPGADTFNITSMGQDDIYVQKLDAGGNLVWAKGMGGISYDNGNAIAVDASGNVYTTGTFRQKVDFDPNTDTFNIKVKGLSNTYIHKLDKDGNLLWVKTMSGGNSFANNEGYSLMLNGKGKIYVTGYFDQVVNFDPNGGKANLFTNGKRDIFIQKLQEGKPVGFENLQQSEINLYPNPTTGLFNIELPEGIQNAQIQIFDITGKTVYHGELYQRINPINLSRLSNGIYHISMITNAGEKLYGKMMVNR
jgi:type IX secretion system substrate protein/beta-propeller repeat-containing protein